MARSSLPLLLLPLCLLPFFFVLSLSADTSSYCTTLQSSLEACAAYFSSSTSSTPPTAACCTALKPTLSAANLNKTVECLCGLSTAASLQQRALQLPKSCNITVTIPSSPCANSSTGTNGSSGSAGLFATFGPSYVAITFTSLISSVFTGALLI